MAELIINNYDGVIKKKNDPWDQDSIPPVDTTRDYILIEVVSPTEAAGELYYYYEKDVHSRLAGNTSVKIKVATFRSGPDRPIVIDVQI
jgi:hypothetical protein